MPKIGSTPGTAADIPATSSSPTSPIPSTSVIPSSVSTDSPTSPTTSPIPTVSDNSFAVTVDTSQALLGIAHPDPLRLMRDQKGITFAKVFTNPEAVERALRKGTDVPGRIQDGPTCGLYALGMVMDYYDHIDRSNLNPLVMAKDIHRKSAYNNSPDTDLYLFDVAKERGYTTKGEMFTADQLGKLATEFGYDYQMTENAKLDDIKNCVDRGHPALVAFDVDYSGNPGMYEGHRAHWAVIEGYFEDEGVEYLVANHGWEGNKEFVWRAEDFMKSFGQLNSSKFPGAPSDITGTLKQRVIEVFPKIQIAS